MPTIKHKTIISFKKAQSLIAKIIQMIEGDQYCVDIMQQNLAVIGLLKSAHSNLMENHLNTCFLKAVEAKNKIKKQKIIQEILKVSRLLNK